MSVSGEFGYPFTNYPPPLQLEPKRSILRPALVHTPHVVHPPYIPFYIRYLSVPRDEDDRRQSRAIRLVTQRRRR